MIWTANFWKQTAEQSVKAAAIAATLVLGAEQVNALTVDWAKVGGFAAGGAVLSVLLSLGSSPFGQPDSPSIVKVK